MQNNYNYQDYYYNQQHQNIQLAQQQKVKGSFLSKSNRLTELHDSTDVTHSSIQTDVLGPRRQNQHLIHLDLQNFKCQPCKNLQQHNHKHCPFYHNAKDRKRIGNFYSADMCEFMERGEICPYGDQCQQSHNRVEQLYQVDKYKTKFCTCYPNNLKNCEYETFCSFAHSENDIVIELIHNLEYDDDFYMFYFKTVWCPFNLTQHDKALCVYAHNWQDYRRKPNVYPYEPIPCPNWKATEFIINYEEGCPNGFNCNKCHGWKEQEYHPKTYRTKACTNSKACQKGKDCPNFHSLSEKRGVNNYVASKIFRYVPKNRIVANTFKVRKSETKQLNANSESFNSFNVFNNSHQSADQRMVGNTSQQFGVIGDVDQQQQQQQQQQWINQDNQLNDSMSMHDDEHQDIVDSRMMQSTQESSSKKYQPFLNNNNNNNNNNNHHGHKNVYYPKGNMGSGNKVYMQQQQMHPMITTSVSQNSVNDQHNYFFSDFSLQRGFMAPPENNPVLRKRSKSFSENQDIEDFNSNKNMMSPTKEHGDLNMFDQDNMYKELSKGVNQLLKTEYQSSGKEKEGENPQQQVLQQQQQDQQKGRKSDEHDQDENLKKVLNFLDE